VIAHAPLLDTFIIDTAVPDLIAMLACHQTFHTQYATQGLKTHALY